MNPDWKWFQKDYFYVYKLQQLQPDVWNYFDDFVLYFRPEV